MSFIRAYMAADSSKRLTLAEPDIRLLLLLSFGSSFAVYVLVSKVARSIVTAGRSIERLIRHQTLNVFDACSW